MAEEGTDRRDPASDRRGRETGCAQLGDVLLELLGRDAADRTVEPGRERRQVAPVGLDRLGCASGREQCEEALDLRIDLGVRHGPAFAATAESPAQTRRVPNSRV